MAWVLLVDDDRTGVEIRRLIFEHAGHSVSAASDAAGAMAAAAAEVVILDLRLPELEDGLALIRELRGVLPQARLIVLSGWPADLDGRVERGMVDEVLAKPVPPERLLRAVSGRAG